MENIPAEAKRTGIKFKAPCIVQSAFYDLLHSSRGLFCVEGIKFVKYRSGLKDFFSAPFPIQAKTPKYPHRKNTRLYLDRCFSYWATNRDSMQKQKEIISVTNIYYH
jgi:hypothetical protein